MGYTIRCDSCKEVSWAATIVDLIDNHLDTDHTLKCSNCRTSGAYIHMESST